jgi:hypothetical protein
MGRSNVTKPKKAIDAHAMSANAEDAWFHSLGEKVFAAEWAREEDGRDCAHLSSPSSDEEGEAQRPPRKPLKPP